MICLNFSDVKKQPDGITLTFPAGRSGYEFKPVELTIPKPGEEIKPDKSEVVEAEPKDDEKIRHPPHLSNLLNREAEEGDSVEFQVNVTGVPLPEVSWYKDKHPITDEPHRRFLATREGDVCTLEVKDVRCSDQGTYSCNAYNNAGKASKTCQLTVKQVTPTSPPAFTKRLKDIHIVEGCSTRFDVKITGSPEPDVYWHKDEKPVEQNDRFTIVRDDDSSALIVKYGQLEDAGEYRCVAMNEGGEAECTGKLIVSPVQMPPLFTEPLKDLQVDEDQPARLDCRITGKPEPEITWYKDDNRIEIDERHEIRMDFDNLCVLMISKADLDDEGLYKCEAKNDVGQDTTSAELVVEGEGRPPEFTKVLNNVEIPEDSRVRLEVRVEGKPSPKVEWCKDGKQLKSPGRYELTKDGSCRSVVILSCRQEDEGTYSCKAFNKFGATSCEAKLTIGPDTVPPRFTQKVFDTTVNEDSNVIFTVKFVGTPEPQVVWFLDHDLLSEDDGVDIETEPGVSSLILEDVALSDAGHYKCVVSNVVNKASTSAVLTVVEERVLPVASEKPQVEQAEVPPAQELQVEQLEVPPAQEPQDEEADVLSAQEPQEDPPKFLKKLINTQVAEGDSVRLEVCLERCYLITC